MKVAIIGSRGLYFDCFEPYLPENTTEILSGGAKGIDTCAKEFALRNNIPYTEYRPNYERYKRAAPIKRNDLLVDAADLILIFWNGESKGTKYVIERCQKKNKEHRVIQIPHKP